jgi:hypothetical protein
MSEPHYTIKEIMDIQFKGLDQKLDYITQTLKDQNTNSLARFTELEKDLKETQEEVSRLDKSVVKIMAIGGTVWSAVTLLGGFVLNRIF